jgi:SpoU rRNA methylase family enzyme
MPAVYKKPDGSVEVVEYQPIEFSVKLLRDQLSAEGAGGAASSRVELNVPPVVKRWLDSLLDLSARNPLINFRSPATCVPVLAAPEILGVMEDLLQNRQIMTLASNPFTSGDPTKDETHVLDDRGQLAGGRKSTEIIAEALSQKIIYTKFKPDSHKANLLRMASSARTFFEETGSNGLYLALGSLVWTTTIGNEERKIRSPLILVPVNLTPKNRGREFYLSIDEGSQVMPNFSVAEKLYREHGIKLDDLVNLVEDESGIDIDGTFAYVRKKMADAGLADFRVDEDAVLGFFNFSTYRLWRDLLDNWKIFEENPLVKHFIHTPNQEFKDPATDPIDNDLDTLVSHLPISSDASQARAVALAMAGRTFILQGPPGTGKSQTITNLLARALSEGKRVLFVAQKKDALDVVKERLDLAGLGAFTLNLHDKGMNPKVVKEQLLNVLDIAIAADRVGFTNARSEYESALSPLQKYRNRLHEIGRLGESIYSALDKKLALQSVHTLPISGEFIAESNVEMKETLVQSAKTIAEIGPQTGTYSSNPWSLATRHTEFSDSELAELKTIARSMRASLESVEKSPSSISFIRGLKSFDELRLTQALQYKEVEILAHTELTAPASVDAQRNSLQTLTALKSAVDGFAFDVSRLDSLDVDMWIGKFHEANTSFALFRGLKLGGVLKKINSILGTTVTTNKTELLTILESLKSLSARKRHAETDLQKLPGVRIDPSQNLYLTSTLDENLALLTRLQELTQFLSETSISKSSLQGLIAEVASGSADALIQLGKDAAALFAKLEATQRSVPLWHSDGTFGTEFAKTVAEWAVDATEHSFSQLTRWVTLLNEAQPFITANLESAVEELLTGRVSYIDAPNAFLDGYFGALVRNLVVERGFNTFEAMTINNHIRKLGDAHNDIRDRLPRITGAELLGRRGFDSSMKVGAIGDLVAALKQARSRVPIRSLLARNWGVVTKVTPCVLAVPDALIRFLDPTLPPFDLVVFDEASQIRVANSIGAIGRAKAVIVVGDSKQMPPTSVAQVRSSDGDDENGEEVAEGLLGFDMESILDHCETARVPDIMLNWHYRSADESLIAFSNKKYYDGKLNSFPSPTSDKTLQGLSFQYVPKGQFIRPENVKAGDALTKDVGTNKEEVEAILKYLAQRLKDPALQNDSIGIVTFNKQQKDYIESCLNNSNDPDIQRAWSDGVGGETIFVKNLESVQGSERDVILFSVAFSKNLNGDLPLNFGPLNNVGGERRLNVAVTRARKQVRIFCSFMPDELLSRNPNTTGVSHLAQYLKMANKEDDESTSIYTTRESHPDRMRKEILAKLRDAGLNAVEEVGLSDFKVDIAIYDPKDSTKALMGILLDGPRWNARETVSDRDCLSVTLLRDRMGWPAIERIWLASWLRNPGDEVQRIVDAYNTILTSGPTPTVKKEKKVQAEPIFTSLNTEEIVTGDNPIDRLLADVEEFYNFPTTIVGDKTHLDYLYDPRVIKVVQEMAHQLTDTEGPVSSERFAKFVGSCFGFDRVVGTRISAINNVNLVGHQRDDEGFIYPKGETFYTFTKWRRGGDLAQRSIQDISLCEISNAMKDICATAHGIRPEQLNKEVSRLFGIAKVSAATNARLDHARNFALSNGRLVQSGEYFQAAQ